MKSELQKHNNCYFTFIFGITRVNPTISDSNSDTVDLLQVLLNKTTSTTVKKTNVTYRSLYQALGLLKEVDNFTR